VNLYRDCNADGIIDKSNCTATTGLNASPLVAVIADVDNWPFVWSEGGAKGAEDIDRNGDGLFDKVTRSTLVPPTAGTTTSPPAARAISFIPPAAGRPIAMTIRNFNQVRPALFDGGYAFGSPAGKPELPVGTTSSKQSPSGYLHQKEEDKNVDFGDEYTPSPLLLPPVAWATHISYRRVESVPGVPSAYAYQTAPFVTASRFGSHRVRTQRRTSTCSPRCRFQGT